MIHQIENQTYEKTVTNQTNFAKTLPGPIQKQAKLAVKDEYTFDFLELGEDHAEMELERALMSKINRFLVEMGGALAFLGDQYRLEIDGQEFFIDILLYHRRLKCLVAVELKVGKFQPEFVGKMQFYLVRWMTWSGKRAKIRPSALSFARIKTRRLLNMLCGKRRNRSAWLNIKLFPGAPADLKGELPAPEMIKALLEDV